MPKDAETNADYAALVNALVYALVLLLSFLSMMPLKHSFVNSCITTMEDFDRHVGIDTDVINFFVGKALDQKGERQMTCQVRTELESHTVHIIIITTSW